MTEEILASVKANPLVQPELAIWGWQIAVYFFLNGIAAGAMVFSALMILTRREDAAPFAARRMPLIALLCIAVAMTALSLDLERMPLAWRFFTFLQMSSSMSRGSWALMVVTPVLALLVLAQMRLGYAWIARLLERIPLIGGLIGWAMDLSHRFRWFLAALCILFGIDLGLHTGVLLSSLSARPLWHSSALPPLLLVSGLLTGAAVILLFTRQADERILFGRIAAGLIVAELVLVILYLEGMHGGTAIQKDVIAHLFDGPSASVFWLGFVGIGLVLPLLLLAAALWRPLLRPVAIVAPILVLAGGYVFGQVMLDLGQRTGGTHYVNQFNPELLKLLPVGGRHVD